MFVKRKLKVMFDLHGVIESQPEIFKPLMKTMRLAGHKVYVCSGPHLNRIEDELKALSIHNFNGRQIKNIIKMSLSLAQSRETKVSMELLDLIIQHMVIEKD